MFDVTPRIRTSPPRRTATIVSAMPFCAAWAWPGKHGLKQYAAALNKNQFAVQAVLLVETDIAREPERSELAAGGRIGDNDTFQRGRRNVATLPMLGNRKQSRSMNLRTITRVLSERTSQLSLNQNKFNFPAACRVEFAPSRYIIL